MADTINRLNPSVRNVVLPTPHWIVSDAIKAEDFADYDSYVFALFKFSIYDKPNAAIRLHDAVAIVDEAFDGTSPDVLVGLFTFDESSAEFKTSDTLVTVDADKYFETGDVTLSSAAKYPISGGDFYTAVNTYDGAVLFVSPTTTATQIIGATISSTAAPTTGSFRIAMAVSEMPLR